VWIRIRTQRTQYNKLMFVHRDFWNRYLSILSRKSKKQLLITKIIFITYIFYKIIYTYMQFEKASFSVI
jgi:hypothetical protein